MNATYMQKLMANLSISYKRFGVVAGGIFTAAVAYYMHLNQVQQDSLWATLHVSGPVATIVGGVVVYYLSIHPQGLPSTAQIVAAKAPAAMVEESATAQADATTRTTTTE